MKYWLSSWGSLAGKSAETSFISENDEMVIFGTKKKARQYIDEHGLFCVIIEKLDERIINEIKRQKIKFVEVK